MGDATPSPGYCGCAVELIISTLSGNLLAELLKASFLEVKDMSKKAPKDALNPVKIKMINRILEKVVAFLEEEGDENATQFLDLLDESLVPTNSDAVLIMSQYVAAMRNVYRRSVKLIKSPSNILDF